MSVGDPRCVVMGDPPYSGFWLAGGISPYCEGGSLDGLVLKFNVETPALVAALLVAAPAADVAAPSGPRCCVVSSWFWLVVVVAGVVLVNT